MPWRDPKILDEIVRQSRGEFSDRRLRQLFQRYATSIGLVESGGANVHGGDADSTNFRQERAGGYAGKWARTGGPYNTKAIVGRLVDEFRQQYDPGEKAGTVAAQVQRPRADLRGRYQGAIPEARALLRGARARTGGKGRSGDAQALLSLPGGPGAQSLPMGSEGLTSLLAALGEQKPQVASAGLASPAFSASAAMPAGYQAPASGGGPAAKRDITGLLEAAQTIGGDIAHAAPPDVRGPGGQPIPQPAPGQQRGPMAALGWAVSKVGFRETGENTGGLASRLNRRFGMQAQPWCAMFTSAAVTRGGAPKSARTASVAEVRRKASAGEGYVGFVNPARARPGDLILFGNAHIGMVQKVANGRIIYVGGNQSDGVTRATVAIGQGDIVRPKYGKR